jgi:hypothetical protein
MKADVDPAYLRKAQAGPRFAGLRALAASLRTWLAACRHYHAAASRYEDLSRLSDAELERRGLTRTSLGQHACEGADRAERCGR